MSCVYSCNTGTVYMNIVLATCRLFLEVKGKGAIDHTPFPSFNRSPSLEQDVLSLVSSLLLKLTKMVRSTMEQKPSAQWRNMHCHIIDSRDLTKEFMARAPPSPLSIAYSCGTLFFQVGFLMLFVALFRYMLQQIHCTANW